MVLDQHQYMVVFGQLQQVHPQQRPPFQVEWLHNDGLYPFDQAFFTELFPLDGNANRRLYLLVRTPSLQPEAGTQVSCRATRLSKLRCKASTSSRPRRRKALGIW